MLKWLSRLIRPVKENQNIQQESAQSTAQQPITQLLRQIRNIGNSEYPFLHKEYSPVSRVPCTDFTGFIINRLRENDIDSISALMREIIRANPGVGIGSSATDWITKSVKEVVQIDMAHYISFPDNRAYDELKAMMLVMSKTGMTRSFWIVDNKIPILFARALCCFPVELKPPIKNLINKANDFIASMKKETEGESSYWENFSLFPSEVVVPSIQNNPCRQKLLSLSLGARLHLFDAVSKKVGELPELTSYRTRDFGLHIPVTTQEILESGLLIKTQESSALANCFTKNDLIATCQQHNIEYKKSWDKKKLLQAVEKEAPQFIEKALKNRELVGINPEYEEDLLRFYQSSQDLEPLYAILCFAE
jgi:hypothetical protein